MMNNSERELTFTGSRMGSSVIDLCCITSNLLIIIKDLGRSWCFSESTSGEVMLERKDSISNENNLSLVPKFMWSKVDV